MVCVFEMATIMLGFLLLVVEDRASVYLSYIVLTGVRCAGWLYNSWWLVGWSWEFVHLYLLLDNNMLFYMGTVATYIFLNYSVQVQYALPAISVYPFLMICLVGNYRVCLKYAKWSKCRVIIFKGIKLFGSIWFLCYGAYVTINSEIAHAETFLLWIFTTSGLYGELYFAINGLD